MHISFSEGGEASPLQATRVLYLFLDPAVDRLVCV